MRVVAKIGTASITDDAGAVDPVALAKLADEVAGLRADGHEVIVVSSGAVAAGVAALGLADALGDEETLQWSRRTIAMDTINNTNEGRK